MTVITIEGRAGAGSPEIGRAVAQELNLDFVDRMLLSQIARKIGATVGALAEQERRYPSLVNKLADMVQNILQRSAMTGAGGDLYFGPGIENLLAQPYHEMENTAITTAAGINEKHFIATTAEVIRDLAKVGNTVILSRGGGAILRDSLNVLRVGIVAEMGDRIERVKKQNNLSQSEAEEYIAHADTAQHRYFAKAFNSTPIDPFLYHFMCNTSNLDIEYATLLIVEAVRSNPHLV